MGCGCGKKRGKIAAAMMANRAPMPTVAATKQNRYYVIDADGSVVGSDDHSLSGARSIARRTPGSRIERVG